MSTAKYNLKNAAVKRILQEVKEMQDSPSDDYMSLPLEENIFEWQFAIRGPRDTEFEGGIYHGRIQLPPEYPFKPPAFMLLTPNGRFETQTKICLSISQYHPEHWQPSWSVRTALVALIAFMPTKGNGAIGSLDFPKEERKALALKSVETPPKYGNAERQKLIDQIHEEMLKRSSASTTVVKEVSMSPDNDEKSTEPTEEEKVVVSDQAASSKPERSEEQVTVPTEAARETVTVAPAQVRAATRQPASDDHFLTLLAIGLVVALAALLIRKFYNSFFWIGFNQ